MSNTTYDVIVIGSGQGGGPIAADFAKAGKRTALIERTHVGGTCINEGCTPTKTMVASGRVAYLARRGADYGVHTGPVTIDMVRIRERKRDIVKSFREGGEKRTRSVENLDLLMGEARFTGPHDIEVKLNDGETRQLSTEIIILNTGARPTLPPLEGLKDVPTLNSTTIMELDSVPEHLLVIGGGYIGLEFAQMFRRFGSEVTIVQRHGQLLPKEDQDVADEVAKILREDGITVALNTNPVRAAQGKDGRIELTVQSEAEGERVLKGSHLLVAAGRAPNTEVLNLEVAGVQTDKKGFVQVNERLETSAPGIYAIGDVKGGPAFTHISYDDFRVLRTNLLHGGNATIKDRVVPYTVFIDPQLGRVGLTEQEARAQKRDILVAKMPMSYVARALEVDETRGFMKAVIDAKSKQILGAAMLGLEGGELMSMIEIAMLGKLEYTVLKDATLAHPTLAESLNNLFTGVE